MEVTVPYSDSYRHRANEDWEKFYRLYYSSTHWVFSAKEGPDGMPWYEIRDGLVDLSYYVPVEHLRPVSADELTPIHADVAPSLKRIEISIDFQKLMAYEGDQLVREAQVSTGVPYSAGSIHPHRSPKAISRSTPTPSGPWECTIRRMPSLRAAGYLVSYFEIPPVWPPWHLLTTISAWSDKGCINGWRCPGGDRGNVPVDGNSEISHPCWYIDYSILIVMPNGARKYHGISNQRTTALIKKASQIIIGLQKSIHKNLHHSD